MNRAELAQRQSLPIAAKLILTQQRIKEWYDLNEGNIYTAFSGGKDSTVLAHIVQYLYKDIPNVFINTGVEFPEIVKFARGFGAIEIHPKWVFRHVLRHCGYPVISKNVSQYINEVRHSKTPKLIEKRLGNGKYNLALKHRYLIEAPFECSDECCTLLKKYPAEQYERKTGAVPMIGMLASDSGARTIEYVKRGGCNAINHKRKSSWPLGIWLSSDIDDFIKAEGIPMCSVYKMGYRHTGCVGCTFGILRDPTPNRYQLLKQTHPRLWTWYLDTMGFRKVLDYIKVPYD